MTKNKIDRTFVEQVQKGIRERDDVSRRLTLASYELDDSADYFVSAIRQVTVAAREVLWSILAHEPDQVLDDPGAPMEMRAQAAHWFLEFRSKGFWPATEAETEYARALAVIHFGEAPMVEKAKAGVAGEDALIGYAPRRGPARKSKHELERAAAIWRECSAFEAALADRDADGWAKLSACQHFFAAIEYLAPEANQKFFDSLREKIQ